VILHALEDDPSTQVRGNDALLNIEARGEPKLVYLDLKQLLDRLVKRALDFPDTDDIALLRQRFLDGKLGKEVRLC
jgi:hypothetical protein